MGKVRILWVSAVSLVMVGVVGALVTLAVLSANSQEDTTPPIISNIYTSATGDTVETSWTTNELATTRVRCSAKGGAAGTVIVGPGGHQGLSTSHTALITGLQPGTTYAITLVSADASGNEAVHEFTLTIAGLVRTTGTPSASGGSSPPGHVGPLCSPS